MSMTQTPDQQTPQQPVKYSGLGRHPRRSRHRLPWRLQTLLAIVIGCGAAAIICLVVSRSSERTTPAATQPITQSPAYQAALGAAPVKVILDPQTADADDQGWRQQILDQVNHAASLQDQLTLVALLGCAQRESQVTPADGISYGFWHDRQSDLQLIYRQLATAHRQLGLTTYEFDEMVDTGGCHTVGAPPLATP